MTNQKKGADFERQTKEFFGWLFEKLGFTILKERMQFSGNQHGFDLQFSIWKENREKRIFIECKNYQNDLQIGNIFKKAVDLEKNYKLEADDLFIAINPHSHFKNEDNAEKMEPVFDEKFNFKTVFLDRGNKIERFFALNEHIYNQIYSAEPSFTIDPDEEFLRIKAKLFSVKTFKPVILRPTDKDNYLQDITALDGYIKRNFSENVTDQANNFWIPVRLGVTDITNTNEKIIILGNPGLGKTTELKQFALSKWKEGEQHGRIPIYRNLKNFTASDTIQGLLPHEFNPNGLYYLIFDGLDEIANIQDFASKFSNFILDSKSKLLNFKYILSCRTNIYESVVHDIEGFEVYYLAYLQYNEAIVLLKSKLVSETILDGVRFEDVHYDFLRSPFLVSILADYLNDKKILPLNAAVLWENFSNRRLESDTKDKFKKNPLNPAEIKKYSKSVALVQEFMKANSISEEDILELVGSREAYEQLLRSPLLDKDKTTGKWHFEHRSVQEYFAARFLSQLGFEDIIACISISANDNRGFFAKLRGWLFGHKRKMKTHPSMYNTVTFLINILDEKKAAKLVKWFETNEPELLFNADPKVLNVNVTNTVFQNYFRKTCIEDELWISRNQASGSIKLARFADNPDNFHYLYDILKQSRRYHFRTVISALDIIAHMTTAVPLDEFKNFLSQMLVSTGLDKSDSKESDSNIKSAIITSAFALKLYNDDAFVKKTLAAVEAQKDDSLRTGILNLLYAKTNIDDYFDFIFREFFIATKVSPFSKKAYKSSRVLVEDLVLKISDPENFLKVMAQLFGKDRLRLDESFSQRLFDKAMDFVIHNEKFLVAMLTGITDSDAWFGLEQKLAKLITDSRTENLVVKMFLDGKIPFDKCRRILSRIVDKANLDLLIEKLSGEDISIDELHAFRNVINHYNLPLALYFQSEMESRGTNFLYNLKTAEELEQFTSENKDRIQQNFDSLFDPDALLSRIALHFESSGKTQLTWDDITDLDSQWYENNEHSAELDISLYILQEFIREINPITLERVAEELGEDVRMYFISKRVDNKTHASKILTVSAEQQQTILHWCSTRLQTLDYDNFIHENGQSTVFSFDFELCRAIYRFEEAFGLELPQEFYLRTLKYTDVRNFGSDKSQFSYVADKIKDKDALGELVVSELMTETLTWNSINSFVKYALEENLVAAFPKIKEMILVSDHLYHFNDNLKNLFEKDNDIQFLRQCCGATDSGRCWDSVRILSAMSSERHFLVDLSRGYLHNYREGRYLSDALGILFMFNEPDAIRIYADLVLSETEERITPNHFNGYSSPVNISVISDLFPKIYAVGGDPFKFHHAKNLMESYILALSENDKTYSHVVKILGRIKKDISRRSEDVFYVNILLKSAETRNLSAKSEALNFEEAKARVGKFGN